MKNAVDHEQRQSTCSSALGQTYSKGLKLKLANLMLAGLALAATAAAVPAAAATNLIRNGSFEAGPIGTGGFTNWTKTNVPTNSPAIVLGYNTTNSYPTGAFGESIFADNIVSASPDAVGSKAAYFVGDLSVNESISQLTYLGVGNYRVGFSYFLTANGLVNAGNASFDATIVGVKVASTSITGASPSRTWEYASGVGRITKAGWYNTAFVFNSNRSPSKDIVIDRVFAVATTDAADVLIPENTTAVPEPETWTLLVLGFGAVGFAARRRKRAVAA